MVFYKLVMSTHIKLHTKIAPDEISLVNKYREYNVQMNYLPTDGENNINLYNYA